MVSMENHFDKFMVSHEEARRLIYLRQMPQTNISINREEILTARRAAPIDLASSHQPQLHQRIRCQTLNNNNNNKRPEQLSGPSSAVSRRNARERKRVRMVNLGFSTLRERVPPGTKNKKLSKVETLRAAIEYIRQLQQILGIPEQNDQSIMFDENDCSSVASSEDITGLQGATAPANGSVDLSPASSHPSDCSLVSSPYAPQHTTEDQLLDIGVWFS